MISVEDFVGKNLPNFGEFSRQKKELLATKKAELDILGNNKIRIENRPAYRPKIPVPKVEEVIGRALDAIGTYNDLDNR